MPAKNYRRTQQWIGKRFGRIVVTRLAPCPYVYGICDCGIEKRFDRRSLSKGHTKSCGCYHSDVMRKHGMSLSPENVAWSQMVQRCKKPNHSAYPDYGGRGISICERWMKFENFLEDMGKRPSKSHSLDRIDNDGNYEPGNCRWATRKEQAKNRRNNRMITYNGISRCLEDWAEFLGMNYYTLWSRLRSGWTIDRVINTPVKSRSVKRA